MILNNYRLKTNIIIDFVNIIFVMNNFQKSFEGIRIFQMLFYFLK